MLEPASAPTGSTAVNPALHPAHAGPMSAGSAATPEASQIGRAHV